MRLALLLVLVPLPAAADPSMHQAEIQHALIQRDRQSAEFSRPELRDLHTRQDQQHRPMRTDERAFQGREREGFRREQPAVRVPDYRPLPLPGGQRHGVDPIPVQGLGG
ncbi:MAG TPA: hypothetical protein VM183_11265 [Burkholderiales bacterium]|nr:hypothetical protein [Burkholderiales bacterium]